MHRLMLRRPRAVLAVFLCAVLCPLQNGAPPARPPLLSLYPAPSSPGVVLAAARRVDKVQFQRMGNFLRSVGAVEELRYLMPLLQKYVVQRSMDNAVASGEAANSEAEEDIFFSLMDEYGMEDHRGEGWSDEDKAEVKKRSVKLVKMMKKRLEALGEDISL